MHTDVPHLPHIAFICSGNICRSPMAEAIARRRLEQLHIPARVSSAGTLGLEEYPASQFSIDAMMEIGIDLTSHLSRGVTADYLGDADAIVVMSPEHERTIRSRLPEASPKIHRLWEHTSQPGRLGEIADPVGCSQEAFIRCRQDLIECVENWLPHFLDSRKAE